MYRDHSCLFSLGLRRRDTAKSRSWRVVAVTEAKLLAAAASTEVIRAALLVQVGDRRHHVGRRKVLLQQLRHDVERRAGVHEELLEAGTEIVLAGFTVARKREPVLGTAAVAPVLHL